jgi:alpha-1,3-mannosyltransferase
MYHEPLLTSFVAIQDTLRTGNSISTTASTSSTTPYPTNAGGRTTLPEATESLQSNSGLESHTYLSYRDCSTRPWNIDLNETARTIVQNVMNPSNISAPRLACPAINSRRYSLLARARPANSKPRYFFALDLFQSMQILEQLLSSIVQAIEALGPENCVLSIVEGRSTDGTRETLKSLQREMKQLGLRYYVQCVDVDPTSPDGDRILALALLRNYALQPLIANPKEYDPETRIIFINDVALCAEDILELIYQGVVLDADMTCAFDWNDGFFYDIWIGRTMAGDLFFEIPQSQSWEFAHNLFWNHELSRTRYFEGRPIQVFSCWNGIVSMIGKPFLEGKIKFRSNLEGECLLGEPIHLAKDLWHLGYGRIAVVPSVNVAYNLDATAQAKERHGTVSSWVEKEDVEANKVQWSKRPPPQIKCFVDWTHPSWEPWDQGLKYLEVSE